MGQRFDRLLKAALERNGDLAGDSLVIQNHLAQMKLFGIRQGVEFFPLQDMNEIRSSFLRKLWTDNKIDLFLERYWDLLLCKGRLCFYLRPSAGGGYRIYHYDKSQFFDFYDADGNLNEIVIKYSYKVNNATQYNYQSVRWVKLRITKDEIIRYDSDFEPELEQKALAELSPSSRSVNTLGWIPCVVVNNYSINAGQDGIDEFSVLSGQIEAHDRMMSAIRSNVEFFGNPTLISSRSLSELTEGNVIETPQHRTSTARQGFYGATTLSTRKENPFTRLDPATGLRVRKVIANVAPDDRIGYIIPDPVSPDQTRFAAEYRESLHTALGGVDPLGISTGATAYEIKSLFGRTAATAKNRATNLYTYGLCKVFEMAIAAEEYRLRQSIAIALELPMEVINDEGVMMLLQTGESPAGKKLPKDFRPIGLPPLGDRTIGWRWTGPVFEDSPQDILQKSIVVRNMEEVGVETTQALRWMLPDKTDKEIKNLVTGFPFREMQESGSALGQHLSILGQMLNTPNPYDPSVPLGISLNNLPVIHQTLAHIERRLNYANSSEPAADDGTHAFVPVPSTSGASPSASSIASNGASPNDGSTTGEQPVPGSPAVYGPNAPIYDANSGKPIRTDPIANSGLAIPDTAVIQYYGNPSGFQPSIIPDDAGSTYPIPEYADQLPIPGSTVSNPGAINGRTPGFSDIPSSPTSYPAGISPSIARQLFPTAFSILDGIGITGRKRQPKRSR